MSVPEQEALDVPIDILELTSEEQLAYAQEQRRLINNQVVTDEAERASREHDARLLALDPATLRLVAATARLDGGFRGRQLSRLDLAASRRNTILGAQEALVGFALECEGLAQWVDDKRAAASRLAGGAS